MESEAVDLRLGVVYMEYKDPLVLTRPRFDELGVTVDLSSGAEWGALAILFLGRKLICKRLILVVDESVLGCHGHEVSPRVQSISTIYFSLHISALNLIQNLFRHVQSDFGYAQ